MFLKIAFVLLAVFFIWRLFGYIKSHPESLSRQNLSKSFFLVGVLTLLLIGFVAALVVFVKQS